MKLKELRQWITANTKTSWGTRKTTFVKYLSLFNNVS